MVDSNQSWLKPALDLQKTILDQTNRSYRTALTVTRDLQGTVTDMARDQLETQFQIPKVELKLFTKTARRFMLGSASNVAKRRNGSPARSDSEDSTSEPSGDTVELEEINGIGPSYAEKLRAAGIQDSSDLAACSPMEIVDVVEAGLVNEEKAKDWIEEAGSQ